jgi:SAM-dependent methyltransferase
LHKKYLENKQQLDIKLEELITSFLKEKKLKVLDACCGIGHLLFFLSSLFYDGDIDFEIKVKPYKIKSSDESQFFYYNVYSLPKFKEFVYNLGAKNIDITDFELDIDLEKPFIDTMGTYTEKLVDGRRLQISGVVLMQWKIIRIDL